MLVSTFATTKSQIILFQRAKSRKKLTNNRFTHLIKLLYSLYQLNICGDAQLSFEALLCCRIDLGQVGLGERHLRRAAAGSVAAAMSTSFMPPPGAGGPPPPGAPGGPPLPGHHEAGPPMANGAAPGPGSGPYGPPPPGKRSSVAFFVFCFTFRFISGKCLSFQEWTHEKLSNRPPRLQ